MDNQESNNKNKAKTWLYRFLKIGNRLQDQDFTMEASSKDVTEHCESNYTRSRSSFRKSLKKMHTRVKSCMFPQNKPKNPIVTITEIPSSSAPPPVPERPQIEEELPIAETPHRIPTDEISSLSMCCWYWGPMSTSEAEEKLRYKPDGTFLVRDSTATSYLFSISFRSVGKTMHARIEYNRGKYNLYGTFTEGFPTITELIQDAMKTSENGIYCYSRRAKHECEFPVRLTHPISRYTEVRSLKYLCKFVIRQCTNNINDIPKLPLPTVLHGYLLEKPYF